MTFIQVVNFGLILFALWFTWYYFRTKRKMKKNKGDIRQHQKFYTSVPSDEKGDK